jgi:uronate dehydrogenase
LAKCFAEDLGSLYWDKKGIESVHLRILSAAQVNNPRALGSWLSYDDLVHLVQQAITTPITGFAVIYGVSNNDRVTVDNHKAAFLGYRPKDNAEQFATEVLAAADPADPHDPGQMCQGGPFASVEIGFSGTATMNIVQDKKEI